MEIIPHSNAYIDKANDMLGYNPSVTFENIIYKLKDNETYKCNRLFDYRENVPKDQIDLFLSD